jgi:hypothetical protein|tara:strand:+ start:258 stop:455 length:198 start_codon:yes stop_codon:yes gene_type:complete
MIYLIIKEQIYEGLNNSYFVVDQTEDLDKANDILRGYNLINKTNKNILHSIIKYESPLVLTKEVA